MGCSYYANLIVGIPIKSEEVKIKDTRYDNITGKPYEIDVTGYEYKTIDGIDVSRFEEPPDECDLKYNVEAFWDWPLILNLPIGLHGDGLACTLGVEIASENNGDIKEVDPASVNQVVALMDDWLRSTLKTEDRARLILWAEVSC